ncbi:MAG: AMP-dependent synthetase/ligase [Actinomycetaceae bacterium]|nr:AMP-dependent synthetase/ligase [Actinomycetaceae bacterium]
MSASTHNAPRFPAGTMSIVSDDPRRLREFSMPKLDITEDWMNIAWLFNRRVEQDPQQTVVEVKSQLGDEWRKISAAECYEEIQAIARGLIGMGLEHGDTLAILGSTSYEWTLIDMAAMTLGIVVVPIYETDSAEQIEWIIKNTNIRVAVVMEQPAAQLVTTVVKHAGVNCKIICLAAGGMRDILEAGRGIAKAAVEARLANVTMDSLATIVYTSGTTGLPKGVELTHGNVVNVVQTGLVHMKDVVGTKKARCLLFLPLAHVYARLLQFAALGGYGVLGHVPDIKNLLQDLAMFKPSYILAVPRVLEKVFNAAVATAGHGIKGRIFKQAAYISIAYSRALDTPEGPSRSLKARHAFYDSLVLHKIRDLLGSNAKYVISGGGPLGERLGHFYRGLGVTVLEGYGLTETIGPFAVNTPQLSKIGSVGISLPGDAVRINNQGELELKGMSLFRGYHNQPELTKEAFTDDGWFNTGDLGWIDTDGYIHMTGRTKEIIVTAGGKNVVPAVLEDRLRGHPLISQVVVVGDRRPFVAALVTLDSEMLPQWLKSHNLPPMDISEAARHSAIIESLERGIERANRAVSRAESIRKIQILTTDFTEENGMLTPSMKVKRRVVLQAFKHEIDTLYGGPLPDDE